MKQTIQIDSLERRITLYFLFKNIYVCFQFVYQQIILVNSFLFSSFILASFHESHFEDSKPHIQDQLRPKKIIKKKITKYKNVNIFYQKMQLKKRHNYNPNNSSPQ